jgi:hypothetical protein
MLGLDSGPERGVAQPGSAPPLGGGGPRFKSGRPDSRSPCSGAGVRFPPAIARWPRARIATTAPVTAGAICRILRPSSLLHEAFGKPPLRRTLPARRNLSAPGGAYPVGVAGLFSRSGPGQTGVASFVLASRRSLSAPFAAVDRRLDAVNRQRAAAPARHHAVHGRHQAVRARQYPVHGATMPSRAADDVVDGRDDAIHRPRARVNPRGRPRVFLACDPNPRSDYSLAAGPRSSAG